MHSSCFPWFVPFDLYQISFSRSWAEAFRSWELPDKVPPLHRAFLTKKGRRAGASRRVTINTFHHIARQKKREGQCQRGAEVGGQGRRGMSVREELRCIFVRLPTGVESFHGEGTSSSFTDRGPLHLPLHSFFASREIFSLPGEADLFC